MLPHTCASAFLFCLTSDLTRITSDYVWSPLKLITCATLDITRSLGTLKIFMKGMQPSEHLACNLQLDVGTEAAEGLEWRCSSRMMQSFWSEHNMTHSSGKRIYLAHGVYYFLKTGWHQKSVWITLSHFGSSLRPASHCLLLIGYAFALWRIIC